MVKKIQIQAQPLPINTRPNGEFVVVLFNPQDRGRRHPLMTRIKGEEVLDLFLNKAQAEAEAWRFNDGRIYAEGSASAEVEEYVPIEHGEWIGAEDNPDEID